MSSLPQRRSPIANTGSAAATIASVSSSDPTRFIINATGSTQIAAGATDTSWTTSPRQTWPPALTVLPSP